MSSGDCATSPDGFVLPPAAPWPAERLARKASGCERRHEEADAIPKKNKGLLSWTNDLLSMWKVIWLKIGKECTYSNKCFKADKFVGKTLECSIKTEIDISTLLANEKELLWNYLRRWISLRYFSLLYIIKPFGWTGLLIHCFCKNPDFKLHMKRWIEGRLTQWLFYSLKILPDFEAKFEGLIENVTSQKCTW